MTWPRNSPGTAIRARGTWSGRGARARAEEIVLPQRVLPLPEAFADDEQDDSEGLRLEGGARPPAVDPGHPSWAEVDAEQRERAGRPPGG